MRIGERLSSVSLRCMSSRRSALNIPDFHAEMRAEFSLRPFAEAMITGHNEIILSAGFQLLFGPQLEIINGIEAEKRNLHPGTDDCIVTTAPDGEPLSAFAIYAVLEHTEDAVLCLLTFMKTDNSAAFAPLHYTEDRRTEFRSVSPEGLSEEFGNELLLFISEKQQLPKPYIVKSQKWRKLTRKAVSGAGTVISIIKTACF